MYSCVLIFVAILYDPLLGQAISRSTNFRTSLSKTVGRLHKRNHQTPQMKLISGFTIRRSSETPSFKFQPPLDDSAALNTLRNKKIVFIGDSITRYQYLNLVYFLERGHFPEPFCTDEKLEHSVCCQRNVGASKDASWNAFFLSTNQGLNGNEICDCARNKHFNLENRVYHNKELNTVVAFFWLGRDLGINLRASMFTHPLQPACSLQTPAASTIEEEDTPDTSSTQNSPTTTSAGFTRSSSSSSSGSSESCNNQAHVASQYHNVTLIGDAISNITVSMNPDVLLMNWGHHTMYKWRRGLGRTQYQSITRAVQKLRADNYKTLLYWKTTTPIFSCENNNNNNINNISPGSSSSQEQVKNPLPHTPSQCGLRMMTETDGQNPVKLGSKLVQDGLLENFDAQHYIKLLYIELRRRQRSRAGSGRKRKKDFFIKNINGSSSSCSSPSPSPSAISSTTTTTTSTDQANPNHQCHDENNKNNDNNVLGWDSLHYYCWVNTELNRALISSYISRMKG